jgi:hypothetical protein
LRILSSFHGFSSFDFITLVTSVTAVAAISGPILQRSFRSEKLMAAERDMKKVAFEIAQIGPKPEASSSRSPASEANSEKALVQKDPWGRPYQLKFIHNSYGIPTHVVVWSYGPNGIQDTSSVESSATAGATAVVFDGDDVGYATSIR